MEKFDVIVVGAGVGGSASALQLARAGLDVLLLDKAKVPGHRNMTGGVLFGKYLNKYGLSDLLPNFPKEAPLERKITDHIVYGISDPSRKTGSYKVKSFSDSILAKLGIFRSDFSTGSDYTVLRVKFDRWLSRQAMAAGAMLATETTVEDLLVDDGKVVGVLTPKESIYSDLVIDASGVTSTLVEKAGLRQRLNPSDVYHGIKHLYSVGDTEIEEKFRVEGDGFKALLFMGDFMKGVQGGGFIYPNKDSISVGLVVSLKSLKEGAIKNLHTWGKPLDLLDNFEGHPMISSYLESATLVEYSSHNIPKGPSCMLKRPYSNGFLVVGDALGSFVKIGPMIDGMRRAIASGMMAAEICVRAKRAGDYSSDMLSAYSNRLAPIYRDIRAAGRDSLLLENRFAYNTIPKLLFKYDRTVTEVPCELKTTEKRDAVQRIQDRTSLLNYQEDSDYSHIRVNHELLDESASKPWISLCPFNCFTLVLDKGVFTSFKDLYDYNRTLLAKEPKDDGSIDRDVADLTRKEIKEGRVGFDHIACVGCGTCGVLGPPDAVQFGHELNGNGVMWKFG